MLGPFGAKGGRLRAEGRGLTADGEGWAPLGVKG